MLPLLFCSAIFFALADNARELATINLALQIRNAHQQDELARYCALLSEGRPLREQIIT